MLASVLRRAQGKLECRMACALDILAYAGGSRSHKEEEEAILLLGSTAARALK